MSQICGYAFIRMLNAPPFIELSNSVVTIKPDSVVAHAG